MQVASFVYEGDILTLQFDARPFTVTHAVTLECRTLNISMKTLWEAVHANHHSQNSVNDMWLNSVGTPRAALNFWDLDFGDLTKIFPGYKPIVPSRLRRTSNTVDHSVAV